MKPILPVSEGKRYLWVEGERFELIEIWVDWTYDISEKVAPGKRQVYALVPAPSTKPEGV